LEEYLHLIPHSQALLELFLGEAYLLAVLGLGVELNDTAVFLEHAIEDFHLGCIVKGFVVEVFSGSFSLLDHALFYLVDFLDGVVDHLSGCLHSCFSLNQPFLHFEAADLVGLFGVVEVEHFEDVGIGSAENILIWFHP
jgi:hypothetical protein